MLVPAPDFAQAKGFIAPPGYRRHRPESTLLYQFLAEHYARFWYLLATRRIRAGQRQGLSCRFECI